MTAFIDSEELRGLEDFTNLPGYYDTTRTGPANTIVAVTRLYCRCKMVWAENSNDCGKKQCSAKKSG